MARQVPPPPAENQVFEERRAAFLSLDVALIRAWAEKWDVQLLPADDASLLRSIHLARVDDDMMTPKAQAESRRWLKAHPAPQTDPRSYSRIREHKG